MFSALIELNGDNPKFELVHYDFLNFVNSEVMGFAKDFYDLERFNKSLNTAILVLISKKGGAKDLEDYRPINLKGGLDEIVAKVPTNKLKVLAGKSDSKYYMGTPL